MGEGIHTEHCNKKSSNQKLSWNPSQCWLCHTVQIPLCTNLEASDTFFSPSHLLNIRTYEQQLICVICDTNADDACLWHWHLYPPCTPYLWIIGTIWSALPSIKTGHVIHTLYPRRLLRWISKLLLEVVSDKPYSSTWIPSSKAYYYHHFRSLSVFIWMSAYDRNSKHPFKRRLWILQWNSLTLCWRIYPFHSKIS